MSFVERIRQLRQQRRWSQAKLSKKLNVHQKQISGYERRIHAPSVELLIRMAELFNVSLDYIAFVGREEKTMAPIADRELMQAVQEIDQLPTEDKDTFKAVLNTFIVKYGFQRLASATQKQTAAN
jgi:transcriptional regulator with XRE-family HTH domain